MDSIESNVVRSQRLAAAAAERAKPPATLADVITPGSLGSYLGPSAWEQVRNLGAKVSELNAEAAHVEAKLAEVVEAIQAKGYRRVRDVAAMAEAALKGTRMPADPPEAAVAGFSALSTEQLRDLQAGLTQKLAEVRDSASWHQSRLRLAARDLVRTAAAEVARRYAALLKEAAALHVQLDAAGGLAGQGVVAGGWRQERWLAPLVGLEPSAVVKQPGQEPCLAVFEAGAGVSGAADEFKAAVRAASGHAAW